MAHNQQHHFALPPGASPGGSPPPSFAQQQQGYRSQHESMMGPPPLPPPQFPGALASPPPRATSAPTSVTPPPMAPQKIMAAEDRPLLTRAPDEETEDGRIRNREAMAKIRDTWIYKQVRSRQNEFTQYRKATFFIGTWNVNAKGKEHEQLDAWLCADWGPRREHVPDLVVVGFQEIVDLNAVNVAVDNKTQQKSQFWSEKLYQTLNDARHTNGNDPHRSYTLLMQRSMVGLLICVFGRRAHQERVKYVSAASVGVGVMGMMGNKGGVAVRLQFYDSTLCFVCSHLAAHRENVTGRNADFGNVYHKTSFDVGEEAIREVIRSGSLSHWVIGSSSVGIADHDIVFWLGDLNYRIDESMPTETVLHLAEKGQLAELRSLDQLNIERAAGRCYEGFLEGELHFPPTYKYQPGTDMYEQRPDKKLRAPAWCDRILWKAQEPSHVEQFTYNRAEQPNVSDHKAVYSTLQITVKDVIQSKREAIYDELMKLLDRYENQTLPMVGLDRSTLDFGEIRYEQRMTQAIQLTNTGSVVAQFRFVPKLDEIAICKPWLTVSPKYGMLIPGDPAATITFTINMDNTTAQSLNSGREVLDDIVILRLEDGRDYYITIKAAYARSCFGMSVDELVMYADPVRSIPLDPIERSKKIDPGSASALCVPKELWRIVDAVYEKGVDTPALFVDTGSPDEVKQIREALDTGSQFGRFSVHSYAEALVQFLSSLSSPVVPPALFPPMEIDSTNIQSNARRVLEELPPVHYNVFIYMISFFRECLVHSERNGLTATKLARIGCQCLAPPHRVSGNDTQAVTKRRGMQLIMLHLLETNSI